MLVAVPKELYPGETRVALIPAGIAPLKKAGLDVAVEAGAGVAALCPDSEYETHGARIDPDRNALLGQADIVLMVRGPGDYPQYPAEDLDSIKEGAAIVAFLDPLGQPQQMQALAARGLTLFSMELIPRITRAQSMDALSSMASIAGYKAVLMGADHAPTMFPMMMTAAGTLKPTKVFVLGAGVAGLQAIATAKRLGAVVEGYDIRTEVREQIESLGAKFVEIKVDVETQSGAGGYAAQQSPEYYARQQELLGQHLSGVDVIVTTAAVPGRKAPTLITEAMMQGLHPGTVIVDLAAERGGNCALTQPGETVDYRGVKILGPLNVPAQVPAHASQMYSRNIQTLLSHLVKDGKLQIDLADEITAGTLVAHDGKVTEPRVQKALEAK
ncbi:MAG: Re/Si-specific NAD(P)(+) transhydrogenase subunit alpha [Bryobacterales bacterium]|nr:Re/Si-specific NAD(P)(+) transhydrogenase subunit alpha [Acidobacteriota bacterium]MCB9384013.1 Re/Si-specific NAD(P)(+) transhydrogenase subunit alpha [Bryobacterales bacterium]